MDKNSNSLNWFEIPATDISRAQKFYETVFGVEMMPLPEMMGMKMTGFPADMGNGKAVGALAQSPQHKPGTDGVVIYLNANPAIQPVVDRVEAAGGKVVMPVMDISPEIGKMAFIIDTEGNKIGIHAQA
ncbi:MAG: VOC family protein [Candidatus Kapaibacterium sp.]